MTSTARPTISLDMRFVSLVLFLVILGMLAVWRPWSADAANTKTVTVTGQATVASQPDLFVFYPSYSFQNTDRTAALADLTKKSDELVAKLKELGVPDAKIKTNSSTYDYPVYPLKTTTDSTYTLQLTINVDTLDLSQKVQAYLATTTPSGSVSPQTTFSDAKLKDLQAQARDAATKDARAKADQYASDLGFSVSKVKTVSDNQGSGIYPMSSSAGMAADSATSSAAAPLTVQPGENEVSYSVSVTYMIK